MTPKLSALQRKQTGSHYTPVELAQFLAKNIIDYVPRRPLRILDPACGDGELLEAIASLLPQRLKRNSILIGFDTHENALAEAQRRLSRLGVKAAQLRNCDFLAWAQTFRDPSFFQEEDIEEGFDVVISNPPYVRTQILGGRKSRSLARQFGISGRVDLYHAFVSAMTEVLNPGGVLGLLCSNRFLSIQAGASLRKILYESYQLHRIFDLGDTRLFEAAVLPAIVIGTRRGRGNSEERPHCDFIRVYECSADEKTEHEVSSVLKALDSGLARRIHVENRVFDIERGVLAEVHDFTEPWRLSCPEHEEWLEVVKRAAPYRFSDFVNIRVGIKTTADNVFIRNDWDELPPHLQPERVLLKKIASVDIADQYWRLPSPDDRRILYTHTIREGKRIPIDLESFPRAKKYLENHRDQLERRTYVIEAGRRWYEIWVPQQPADWARPKVIFPDISENARFFFDAGGTIVDGNCYWFTSDSTDHLYLLLAIANSPSAIRFYDIVCGNRLYSGRRRFITQYVEKFPVPDPESQPAREIISLTKELYALEPFGKTALRRISELNDIISNTFSSAEELVR